MSVGTSGCILLGRLLADVLWICLYLVTLPFGLLFCLGLCFFHSSLYSVDAAVSLSFSVLHIVYLKLHLPLGLASCGLCCRSGSFTGGWLCPSSLSGLVVLFLSLGEGTLTSLPALVPLWILHSTFLKNTGFGLPSSRYLGFVTPDEHQGVGGTLREQNVHSRGESDHYFCRVVCAIRFDLFLIPL